MSGKVEYHSGEKVAPYITLTALKVGTMVNKRFSFQASARDQSGIQAMIIVVNGTRKKRENSSLITYTSKKITKAATINVVAYDALGNAKTSTISILSGRVTSVKYY